MADFRADYLVTSVGAIESDGALMEFDVNEANVVKTMMAHARNILLDRNITAEVKGKGLPHCGGRTLRKNDGF